jgi:hypothetical protein
VLRSLVLPMLVTVMVAVTTASAGHTQNIDGMSHMNVA